MSATSEDKNNDQCSADLAETPELVVTTQDIMVAEQNNELATATDFETPDTTTTRQQDQRNYSPFRDGENRPGTTADPPNNAGNQERSSYHMGTTLTATTDRIDHSRLPASLPQSGTSLVSGPAQGLNKVCICLGSRGLRGTVV